MLKKKITINSPDIMKTKGISVWLTMFSELWGSRELIWRLMIRDISVRYRQSVFGYVWAILPQIVTVAIFTYLSQHRVLDIGQTQLPYIVHALWSISVWQLFSTCLTGCTNSLVNAGSLVTKANFPKESLVVASIGQAIFDFLIRLLPVTIVIFWYGFVPSWHIIFIPCLLFFIIMMAIGVGFILSIINLALRDVSNAVSIMLTFGIFLSPILYPPPMQEPLSLINWVNPFSPLLISTQEFLSGVPLSYPYIMSLVMIGAMILFMMGWRIFHITMPRIAERA
ncbi:ABC transporter permease [Desulfocicer niacini]